MTSTISLFDAAVFVAAIAAVFAYLCRLDALHVRRHKPAVIVMHIAWAVASGCAAGRAWVGSAELIDVAVVVGSLFWIWISLSTWRDGVPRQFDSGPVPLDEFEMRCVSGRGKCP